MAYPRSSLGPLAAATFAAAVLAGCGSDGDPDGTAGRRAEQETPIRGEGHARVDEKPGTSTSPGSGAGASRSSSATAAPAASSSRCAADALRVVSTGSQGAAGTQFASLRFELRGAGRCTLTGYPGVALLDGARRLDVDVGRFSTGRPLSVRVDARHPAYFDLSYRTTASAQPGEPGCRARITGLAVIPPDERTALPVRLRPSPPLLCLGSVRVGSVRPTSRLSPGP